MTRNGREARIVLVIPLCIFVLGLFVWTLLEYVIHGWLSHTFHTFATALHAEHHRSPARVFTIGAWLPVSLIWIAGLLAWGLAPGMVFFSGIAAGFIVYEALHYRFHFVWPRSRWERHLRARHLAHHRELSQGFFGVTSALWDLVFGTELTGEAARSSFAMAAAEPPLTGPTNIRWLLGLRHRAVPRRSP